ncbi:class I SAM-dependent RNA methyltransferase [Spirulina sp. CS-785/01]|uniref:THUMP domain-containing class I SAM-dependent RNA methyltransferase n=1 Tax=Spirulina sp. CS-785/01 TaxID=3021716 RepID=UPI00232E35D3|nr:class I SAM-dependent RNA methyltransferase [Spirulina sp. CS-785/01]MDB9314916.1 class I SAM-dependent RNA methyltransferase [Spirulina sp. CS-785/01]
MVDYFATVARGLESLAAQELKAFGAEAVTETFTGVHFSGDRTLLYKVNLWTRLIFRVLVPIAEFPCNNAQQLYREVQNLDWRDYLSPDDTLAVHCTGKNRQLNHSHYTALQVKNAITDQQRQQTGKRSSVDRDSPDLSLNLHIQGQTAVLSLDSSGDSLHRRGYRPAMGVAPLKETLAAALIDLSEWHPETPFLDPLCGSGTLPIEATLKALNIAPGLLRGEFAFERWRDFDPQLWEELKAEAEAQQHTQLPAPIWGCEQNADILQQAQTNSQNCGIVKEIHWQKQDLSQLYPPCESGIILCNPPYGKRVGDEKELASFYKLMGDVLKQRFTGWTAYILMGNKSLAKNIGLKTSARIPVYNGSIPCILSKYELY